MNLRPTVSISSCRIAGLCWSAVLWCIFITGAEVRASFTISPEAAWPVPSNWHNGGAGVVDVLIEGTLPTPGDPAHSALAQQDLRLVVPPLSEALTYDGPGRLTSDAFWTYTWDGPGRLTRMVRKPGTSSEPNAITEIVEFTYDADGRRTEKKRTVTFPQNVTRVDQSVVLWSGWLPLVEMRFRDGQSLGRKWFQWGADLSGTLEGAGGIGGLVAIIDENPFGATRTLVPLSDGLGNIVGVINQATLQPIARYAYGPFGESMAVAGEADACPFRYQTKWYDTESEHYYFGYRYYDPRLGRWLSRDPQGEAGGFNLYAYCGNDPVNQHDPLGLSDKGIFNQEWGLYNPGLFGQIYGWLNSNWREAKASESRSIAFGGRSLPTPASINAQFAQLRAQYAYDVDHGVDTSTEAYQETYRQQQNGLLAYQGLLARQNKDLAQPAFDTIGAFLLFSPGAAELVAAKKASSSMAASINPPGNVLPGFARTATKSTPLALPAPSVVPNAGGVIRSFVQKSDQVYHRVFSGSQQGSFLTVVPPKSSAFAREALALPPSNQASFIQEVLVPAGTRLQRSRALRAFGGRGGAEQFELLEGIPNANFGAGVPLP